MRPASGRNGHRDQTRSQGGESQRSMAGCRYEPPITERSVREEKITSTGGARAIILARGNSPIRHLPVRRVEAPTQRAGADTIFTIVVIASVIISAAA